MQKTYYYYDFVNANICSWHYIAPQFAGATANSVVQALSVTDPDSAGTNVACAITNGNALSKFQLRSDNKTIELQAAIEPDSSTNNPVSYTLTVVCYDNIDGAYSGGSRSSTGTVSVTVTPVNDFTPAWGTFTPAWSSATTPITTIDENTASSTTIFTAAATDDDYGDDGTLEYSLTYVKFNDGSTDASGLFTIGSTSGVVTRTATTTPAIDRETFQYIDFVVHVTDKSTNVGDRKTATQSVRVDIKDVNEFDPTFSPSTPYSATILESESVKFNVCVRRLGLLRVQCSQQSDSLLAALFMVQKKKVLADMFRHFDNFCCLVPFLSSRF